MTKQELTPITSDQYRDVLRHFPAGVTVVTIKAKGQQHGLTVSAFTSVSPSPPLILVCIDHKHDAHKMMERSDAVFAVNILKADQDEISNQFAFKPEERFTTGTWNTAVTGAPVLDEALAWLDCTIYSRHTAGTHTIYIGEVQASHVLNPEEKPLVYWNRNYRQID